MIIRSSCPFQFFSDGEDVAVIQKKDSGLYWVYYLKQPLLKNWSLEHHRDFIDCMSFGGWREQIPGLGYIDLDLSLRGGEGEYRELTEKALKYDLNIFNKHTVREMFTIINRKIDKR